MSKHNLGKFMVIGMAVVAAVAMPLSASAHGWDHDGGWGRHGGWDHDGWRHGGYYHHGGYWSGGRWIAGAIVTGAVAGIVSDALAPRPVYYSAPPVVYGPPTTVIYEDAPPVVTRRVVTRTVVYDNGYPTRYVRDDGYDGD
ncbi:MAG: hypothetical protein RSP_10410 [Rhodanobacter sp.]